MCWYRQQGTKTLTQPMKVVDSICTAPSMLGSPSSRDRMYLLRKRVQKLRKNHSVR